MRKLLGSLTAVLALATTVAGCGDSDTGADGTTHIKIGYPSDTASYGDLYVCQDQGIFKKHNLEVDLTLLKTSSQLVAAMSSNTVQIAGGDGRAIAGGAIKGVDLKMIEVKLPSYFVEMWGESDIRSIGDLKGKTVGVTAPGSVTDSALRLMLKDKGLDKDVKVTNLTSLPALMAAGKSGEIDALVTAPPQGVETKSQGWHKVTDMTNYKTAASVYAVKGSYAKSDAKTVQNFVEADLECLAFLQKDANRDKSVNAIAKYTKTTDKAQAAYAYDFFKKVWATDPVVDSDLVSAAFEDASGKAPGDVSKYIDSSFLDKARKDGFIDEVNK